MITNVKAGVAIPHRLKVVAAFFAIYIFWGSTYLALGRVLAEIPPLFSGGARFLLAGILLYAIARMSGIKSPEPIHWKNALVTGAAMFLVAQGLGVVALTFLPTGLTALLGSTSPVWITLFILFIPNEKRPDLPVFIGLGICLLGIAIPANPFSGSDDAMATAFGALLLIVASVAWAAGTVYARIARLPESTLMCTAIQMISGGLLMLLVGLFIGEASQFDILNLSPVAILSFLYLTIFGSVIAYSAYFWLMKVSTPPKVGTHAYINPMVAMTLGVFFAGESVTMAQFISAPVILFGVFLITSTRRTFRFTGFKVPRKQTRHPLPNFAPAAPAAIKWHFIDYNG